MTDEQHYVIRPEDRHQGWRVARACADYLRAQCEALTPESQGIEVVVRPYRRKRSLAQNRLYWWWLKQIADHINASQGTVFSDEEMHEWMKRKFLGAEVVELHGEKMEIRKSTRKLTTHQFTEYLEQIDWFCVEHLDLVLPRPADLYEEAIGRKRNAA